MRSTLHPAARGVWRRRSPRRSGITVIEMLVAGAVALVVLVAMVSAFRVVGNNVAIARATMEMSGQLRSVSHRLHEDLRGVTVPLRPWTNPSAAEGYFEYIEDLMRDIEPTLFAIDNTTGDVGDVLMFTARTDGEPFVGRFNGATIESRVAEIVWWTHFDLRDDRNGDGLWNPGEQLTLHRRVLLIRPDLTIPPNTLFNHYNDNDVSVRFVGPNLVANSLGDLTMRENRFAHAAVFPHALDFTALNALAQAGNHDGEDVILSSVVAFDVKAYDPMAPIFDDGNQYALVPGDPEYANLAGAGATRIGRGAFVDLTYNRNPSVPTIVSHFSKMPEIKSQLGTHFGHPWLPGPPTTTAYCTWSTHYESDNINQDVGFPTDYGPDAGTDGLDQGAHGVDDMTERDTSPPYTYPLRGLKVVIRIVERDTQQVRQTSVVTDFVPE